MRCSMRAAASWVVDGTNSDGQVGSTNKRTAAKPYGMMDHLLNELLVWFEKCWSVIGGDVNLGMDAAKSDACGIMVLRSGKLSQSKIGPKRQPAYLWNAESKLYKTGMGLVCGFRCEKIRK